jgi:cytochrome P450
MIVHKVRQYASRMRTIVGPLRLRQDPLGFLLEAAREQAEVAYLGAGPRPIYLINDPALIRYVLQDNRENYRKSPQIKRIKSLFGEGLTTSDGVLWQRQRRLILPLFHHKYVTSLAPLITEITSKRLTHWRNRAEHELRPMDVTEEMTGLTRDIMMRVLFGSRLSENMIEVAEALKIAVEYVNQRVRAIAGLPQFIPTARNRIHLKALRVLETFMQNMIDEHRRSPNGSCGLLGLLADLRSPPGGDLIDDRQVRDEAMTMLVAGHTTAAAGLAWVCVMLAQNPEVESQLRYELRRVLGRRVVAAGDLSKLVYLKQVIQEALRLFPPTWITARTPLAADRFRGWRIPTHSLLLISPYTMHRCPKIWDEPERFVPERFQVSTNRDPYTYLPFGRGARVCIGQALAMMKIQLVLATIVRDHCFRLDPGAPLVPEADLTLRPRGAFMTLNDVI